MTWLLFAKRFGGGGWFFSLLFDIVAI